MSFMSQLFLLNSISLLAHVGMTLEMLALKFWQEKRSWSRHLNTGIRTL